MGLGIVRGQEVTRKIGVNGASFIVHRLLGPKFPISGDKNVLFSPNTGRKLSFADLYFVFREEE